MTSADHRHVPLDPADIAMLAEGVGPRPPGSPQEHRAVELVQQRLQEAGVASVALPIRTARRSAPVYTVLLALGALGVLLAIRSAAFGFLVSLIALVVLALELVGFPVLSRVPIIGRPEHSRNLLGIIPPGDQPEGERPALLVVLSAHLDTSRGISRHDLAGRLHPVALGVLAAALVAPIALLLVALTGSIVFRVLAGICFVVLAVAVVALAGRLARSSPGSGADDNASGVAALLAVARALTGERPERVETWLLFTSGADDGRSGMMQFLAENQFDPATTYFVDVDHVGTGQLCYTRGEGVLYLFPASTRLTELAGEIAATHPEFGLHEGVSRWPGTELATSIRGYQALAVIGGSADQARNWRTHPDTVDNVRLENVEHAADVVLAMIRHLDQLDPERDTQHATQSATQSATQHATQSDASPVADEEPGEAIWQPAEQAAEPASAGEPDQNDDQGQSRQPRTQPTQNQKE